MGDRGSRFRSCFGFVSGLLFTLAASTADASCTCGAWVSPPNATTIPRNPLLLLGRCGDVELASYRPYLASLRDSVPLSEVDRFGADFSSSIAFTPAQTLLPGTRYELRFRRAPKDVDFPVTAWTTAEVEDRFPPVWSGEPAIDPEQSRSSRMFGWQAVLKLPVEETEGATWAVVEVENDAGEPLVSGGAKRRLWHMDEAVRRSGIRLEVSECSDGLGLRAGKPYRLRFKLMDMSGNLSEEKEVRFRIPEAPAEVGEVHTWVGVESVLFKVEPEFGELARKARITGTVEGHLVVDEGGVVTDVQIEKAMGFLEKYTTEALKQWRFLPSASEQRLPFKTFFFSVPPVFVPDWSAD